MFSCWATQSSQLGCQLIEIVSWPPTESWPYPSDVHHIFTSLFIFLHTFITVWNYLAYLFIPLLPAPLPPQNESSRGAGTLSVISPHLKPCLAYRRHALKVYRMNEWMNASPWLSKWVELGHRLSMGILQEHKEHTFYLKMGGMPFYLF